MAFEDAALEAEISVSLGKLTRELAKAEARMQRTAAKMERDFRAANKGVELGFRQTTNTMNGMAASLSKIGVRMTGLFAGAAVGVFAAEARGAVTALAQIGDEARRAGLGTDAFQALGYVASQTRIPIDAIVDGMKELNLRADEFVVTGKGSAAEAFARLGYRSEELARKLKDPEELLLEIIGRLEDFDRAAQIRIADEVFGGTGGERFVELISQGEDGLRDMVDRARDLGLVIDSETITKAAELDAKFAELQKRISTFGKKVAVAFADAAVEAKDLRAKLDEIFPNEGQGRAVLGDEAYDALDQSRDKTDAAALDIAQLRAQYTGLAEDAGRTAAALEQAATQARSWGYDGVAGTLADSAVEMRRLADEFSAGTLEADAFADGLADVQSNASAAFGEMDAADKVDFSVAISEVARLGAAIASALDLAASLGAAIRGAAGLSATLPVGPQNGRGRGIPVEIRPSQYAPETSPRPQLPSVNHSFGVPDAPKGGGRGGGGGGGAARQTDYQRELERTREEISKLEIEAASLLVAADYGSELGDAFEYARKRAELLHAAQQDGRELTPELVAEIDKLARSYMAAGMQAEEAEERMTRLHENAERGADAVSDIFLSALNGADSAKEAVLALIQEILQLRAVSGFRQMALSSGGGGFFSWLGGLLGGARAAGGSVMKGVPYMVNENTPRSEVFVPGESGRIMTADQATRAIGGSGSGGGAGVVRVEGGNLMLTDSGEIMSQVRVVGAQAESRAVGTVRKSFGNWQDQLRTDGALS